MTRLEAAERVVNAARHTLVLLGTPSFYDVRQEWAREMIAAIAEYDAVKAGNRDPTNPFQERKRP